MTWFYEVTLPTSALLATLPRALAQHQCLCGRYAPSSRSIKLCNEGVAVTVADSSFSVADTIGRLPSSPDDATPRFFSTAAHEEFVPDKSGMDPDPATTTVPLFALKITQFAGGGTAIGILAQHGVYDAEALVLFMKHWGQTHRGAPLDPAPDHNRLNEAAFRLASSSTAPEVDPEARGFNSFPAGERPMPEFAGVMPKIMGKQVVVVPFPAPALAALKAAAMETPLPDGQFLSTDDVLTARTWQRLCAMRCKQLGLLAEGCDEETTLARAVNIRQRTAPKLEAGYCGNATLTVRTSLAVRELLSLSVRDVALRLRAALRAQDSGALARTLQLHHREHEKGNQTFLRFDKHALTFIVSSWRFDWEGADFDAKPAAFEHGAHVPVVAVFTPRPKGDGINLWTSGPQMVLEELAAAVGVR